MQFLPGLYEAEDHEKNISHSLVQIITMERNS